MAVLDPELRALLQRSVLQARQDAEEAAKDALEALRVDDDRLTITLDDSSKRLRRALRARMRQLGTFEDLVMEVAYDQWHLMLFTRFLAENDLLMHPDAGVAVSIAECGELAPDLGEPDEWMAAARFASAMLPGIFRPDDPSLQVRFAQEGRARLERTLASLPAAVFVADDSLGWVYQFWQTEAKKAVNVSARKVGGRDLAPVTQLFTENYMVQFLLQNSLGAWWAASRPTSALVATFEYLRMDDDGRPAAGMFESWPRLVRELRVVDPCCGSGHFLVEAFRMLAAMRMEEEGLDASTAASAVLRDNIFGLELDPRCTQIAAFGLAFAAWRLGGYRPLPLPNVACSGIPAEAPLDDWKQLAAGDAHIEESLRRLHELFRHADTLGSLINPPRVARRSDLFDIEFTDVAPTLEKALASESIDPATAVFGAAAAGIARAANLLSQRFDLVVTNVPYLTAQNQTEILRGLAERDYAAGRHDLATTFVLRLRELADDGGTVAVVSPQGWSYQPAYKEFRRELLSTCRWNAFAKLGPRAFEGISGEVVSVSLFIATPNGAISQNGFALDLSEADTAADKAGGLREMPLHAFVPAKQRRNPDSRIIVETDVPGHMSLLSEYADSRYGLRTGDANRFIRHFWELDEVGPEWRFHQGTPDGTSPFSGRESILRWGALGGLHEYAALGIASLQGADAWGREGIVVKLTGDLTAALYTGESFDNNVAVVWPYSQENLSALWAYLSSPDYSRELRRIDQSLKVMNQTLLKVPFDVEGWRAVADATGTLPAPSSDDPRQWIFNGDPKGARSALQVAVARLVGYRWPFQGLDRMDDLADNDGIVPLPAMPGQLSASDRLRALLHRAYGDDFSQALIDRLVADEGYARGSLEDWLQDKFFEQHVNFFRKRPFVWHISDGRKDGFSALVNYHRLNRRLLEKLTFATVGTWIEMQRAQAASDSVGADLRLAAATTLQNRLKAVLEGEATLDIYVRWKSLAEQPLGWDPDLNDGVRVNIRPFVNADVFRVSKRRMQSLIKWGTDRGQNPDGSTRDNDRHLSLADKHKARSS
jgi:hypothetical protein